MARYFCKVNKAKKQFRVTIPKALITALGWKDVDFVILDRIPFSRIVMRRFVNGKDLKPQGRIG